LPDLTLADGTPLAGYPRPAYLTLAGYEFPATVVWADTGRPYGLLGRRGFNEHFEYHGDPLHGALYVRRYNLPFYRLHRFLNTGWVKVNVEPR
jgi:hypothetical protein